MRGGGAGPEYQCRAAATSPLNITATGGDNALAGAGAGAGVEAMVMLTPHQAGHRARSPEAHHNRDHNQVSGGRVVTAPAATSGHQRPCCWCRHRSGGAGAAKAEPCYEAG